MQRPAKQEMNQKKEQVDTWLKEQYPAIHAQAKAEKAEPDLFAADSDPD